MRRHAAFGLGLLSLFTGCMEPVGVNEPPRGDREDHALSSAYRRNVPQAETQAQRELGVQFDVDLLEFPPEAAATADAAFEAGEFVLHVSGGADTMSRNGLRVGVAGRKFFGALASASGAGVLRRKNWQTLLVPNGGTGSFRLGEDLTQPLTLHWCDRRQEMRILQATQAGALLEVSPKQLASGELRIRLVPLVRYFANGLQNLTLLDLATDIEIRGGESIAVGDLPTELATYGSTFLKSPGPGGARRVLLITPKVVR